MTRILALLALGLTLAIAHPGPAAPLAPLVSGWEQYFKLDWKADSVKGQPVVWGHILNDWGVPARGIQLLVEGLDPRGQVTSQRVAWLGSDLTPGTRAYFEVPAPGAAPSYRVQVFAFEWIQAGGERQ